MLVRANNDGTYCANWTPGGVGFYNIHVTIDGFDSGGAAAFVCVFVCVCVRACVRACVCVHTRVCLVCNSHHTRGSPHREAAIKISNIMTAF